MTTGGIQMIKKNYKNMSNIVDVKIYRRDT